MLNDIGIAGAALSVTMLVTATTTGKNIRKKSCISTEIAFANV